jgi:DHA2 family multidrug resistance protein
MEVLDTHRERGPAIHAGGLGASRDQSTWVLTTYLVANAVVLPMGGWASSDWRKNFFLLCIVIFTGGLLSMRACSLHWVVAAFRVIQGCWGGGLQPMAQAIMADSLSPASAVWRSRSTALLPCWPVHWSNGWRLADRQLQLALDLLHQHSDRNFALVLVQRLVEDPPYLKPDRPICGD